MAVIIRKDRALRCISAIVSAWLCLGGFSTSALSASASWRCDFPSFAEPLTFVTEAGSGKGKIIGNAGTADVLVVEGTGAISFIEILGSGAVQLTTIVIKTGEAAHSRNSLLFGEDGFMPSQTIGKCKPWN